MKSDNETVSINHGWQCRYTPTIMDGPVFRWGLAGNHEILSASRNGVMVSNTSAMNVVDQSRFLALFAVAATVSQMLGCGRAWTLHGPLTQDVERIKDYLRTAQSQEGKV